MSNNDGNYKCPKCGVTAVIEGLKITVQFLGPDRSWPKHFDCELGKPIDKIDFTKLEKL